MLLGALGAGAGVYGKILHQQQGSINGFGHGPQAALFKDATKGTIDFICLHVSLQPSLQPGGCNGYVE